MVTINNSINDTVGASNAGATNTLTVTNPDNTNAASSALAVINTGGSSAGDPKLTFTVTGQNTFSLGLDNSDSDKLKVSENAAIGTSDRIALTPGNDGNLVITLEDHGQTIIGTGTPIAQAAVNFHRLAVTQTVTSGVLVSEINNNDNAQPDSHAQLNIYVGGTSAGDPSIYMDVPAGTGWAVGIDNSDTDAFKIGTGVALNPSTATNVFKSTTAGEITMPLTPAFLVQNDTNNLNVTGDGTVYTIPFATEIYDQNSDFATPNFTAPVTGRYHFCTQAQVETNANETDGNLLLNTSNRTYWLAFNNPVNNKSSAGAMIFAGSTYADMDAGDTAYVTIKIAGGAKDADVYGAASTDPRTYFSGMLAC